MKVIRLIIAAVALLLVLALGFGVWIYRLLHNPVSHTQTGAYTNIPRGTPPAQIVDLLAARGIVRDRYPILLYMKLTGLDSRLKAGDYKFPSPITSLEVLDKLQEGQQRLSRFTVIEGWTRWDVADALLRVPELNLMDRDAALALMNDTTLISELDSEATNLEGYLYPDTYNFPSGSTPETMIETMVQEFHRKWTDDFATRARALNKTTREIVTIASLIETESKIEEERPIVASVIYNRLQLGMALGVDSSVIYASKLAGKWRNNGKVYQSDLDRDSPYNTRKVAGLPPGPIASPSLSSLEAALSPATTDYLYYVRDPARNDGAHNFYSDARGFERGVQALREWERTRDASR